MMPNEYQKLAARTLISGEGVLEQISQDEIMILWNVLGLAGEAGEIVEFTKKGIFHRHWRVETTDTLRNIMTKELGDLLWYAAGICTKMGIDLEEVMKQNIDKLKRRYPEGFSYDQSRHRGDEVKGEDSGTPVDVVQIPRAVGFGNSAEYFRITPDGKVSIPSDSPLRKLVSQLIKDALLGVGYDVDDSTEERPPASGYGPPKGQKAQKPL